MLLMYNWEHDNECRCSVCPIIAFWRNDARVQHGATVVFLAAELFLSAPLPRAAENAPRPQPCMKLCADHVQVQPSAKEFVQRVDGRVMFYTRDFAPARPKLLF
jgi:hypothetical protein